MLSHVLRQCTSWVSTKHLIILWLSIGGLLRCLRLGQRWTPANWDYASYHTSLSPSFTDLNWLITLRGLHPPLYDLLLVAVDAIYPSIGLYMCISISFSWLTCAVICLAAYRISGTEAAALGAALLAISPVQLAYSAEVLIYPMLSLAIAALLLGPRKSSSLLGLLGATLFASYTHVLGAVASIVHMAFALKKIKHPIRLTCLFGCALLPLAYGVFSVITQGEHSQQPSFSLTSGLDLLWQRFSFPGVMMGSIYVFALIKTPNKHAPAIAMLIALTTTTFIALVLGFAAPHQFQYLSLLAPPAALALALGTTNKQKTRLHLLCMAMAAGHLLLAHGDWQSIHQDLSRNRAIDQAIANSKPGDALWIVGPTPPDDDKRQLDPAMWRINPFTPMPAIHFQGRDHANHRFGQPRSWRGRDIYVFTRAFKQQMQTLLNHSDRVKQRTWIVLHNVGPRDTNQPILQALAMSSPTEIAWGTNPVEYLWLRKPAGAQR